MKVDEAHTLVHLMAADNAPKITTIKATQAHEVTISLTAAIRITVDPNTLLTIDMVAVLVEVTPPPTAEDLPTKIMDSTMMAAQVAEVLMVLTAMVIIGEEIILLISKSTQFGRR